MSALSPVSIPRAPSLLGELKQRPGLLLLELLWRWSCGGLLLLLAGYEAWHIWLVSLPALKATGLLTLTPEIILETPDALIPDALAGMAVLWPPVMRGCLGLAPVAIFSWVLAFAWGRSAVLARYDPRLPHRPWLLAEAEAMRIGGQCVIVGIWCAVVDGAFHWTMTGSSPNVLLYGTLIAAATVAAIPAVTSLRRAMVIAIALAFVEGATLSSVLRRASGLHRLERMKPLRQAVQRIRLILLATGLVLMIVPDPFPLGWRMLAWWVLLSLPSLAATDAWRLGAFFLLLRAAQEEARRIAAEEAS